MSLGSYAFHEETLYAVQMCGYMQLHVATPYRTCIHSVHMRYQVAACSRIWSPYLKGTAPACSAHVSINWYATILMDACGRWCPRIPSLFDKYVRLKTYPWKLFRFLKTPPTYNHLSIAFALSHEDLFFSPYPLYIATLTLVRWRHQDDINVAMIMR